MSKKVLIYGAGKLAERVCMLAESEKTFEIEAFLADRDFIGDNSFMGKPLIDFKDAENRFSSEEYCILLTIGYKSIRNREILFNKVKSGKFSMTNLVSKNSLVDKSVQMGVNNIIFDGAYLGSSGVLGDNNLISPMDYIGHDFKIGSHNYFAPACAIGSTSAIGDLSFIGIGSTAINGLKIADETLLGAGSVLLKDTEPHSFYAGNPARKVKNLSENGIIV